MMARQGEMALVISPIFLAVVSLLAMASMQSALLGRWRATRRSHSRRCRRRRRRCAAERHLEAGNSGPLRQQCRPLWFGQRGGGSRLPPRPGVPMPIAV